MAKERPSSEASQENPSGSSGESFLKRRQADLFLAGLLLYVFLLLIGTIGNLFEIEAITGFWLYR